MVQAFIGIGGHACIVRASSLAASSADCPLVQSTNLCYEPEHRASPDPPEPARHDSPHASTFLGGLRPGGELHHIRAGDECRRSAAQGISERLHHPGLHRRRRHGHGLDQYLQGTSRRSIAAVCDVYEPHLRGPVGGRRHARDLRRFSPRARPQGYRRGRDRHARPLARDHRRSGLPGRQGRLLREAAGAPHPGRPGHGEGGRESTSASPRWAT